MKKPFEDDEEIDEPKNNLKKVSSQKSMFDGLPKKPSKNDFDKTVKESVERSSTHKTKAAELSLQFSKIMLDKTLKANKTVFAKEIEQDLLAKMVQLAIEINDDPNEKEGMGSLSWVILLLRTCFYQRDRLNDFEYQLSKIEEAFDKKIVSLVSREVKKSLESK